MFQGYLVWYWGFGLNGPKRLSPPFLHYLVWKDLAYWKYTCIAKAIKWWWRLDDGKVIDGKESNVQIWAKRRKYNSNGNKKYFKKCKKRASKRWNKKKNEAENIKMKWDWMIYEKNNNTNKNDYMYTYALSPSQTKLNQTTWCDTKWSEMKCKKLEREHRESYNNFI